MVLRRTPAPACEHLCAPRLWPPSSSTLNPAPASVLLPDNRARHPPTATDPTPCRRSPPLPPPLCFTFLFIAATASRFAPTVRVQSTLVAHLTRPPHLVMASKVPPSPSPPGRQCCCVSSPPAAIPPTSTSTASPSSPPLAFGVGVVLASGAAALAGVLAGRWDELVAVNRRPPRDDNAIACSSCNGTGYVDCFCTRWDYSSLKSEDGARKASKGCSKCHGTQKEPCSKCGGGGLLVPMLRRSALPARISDDNGRRITALAAPAASVALGARSRLMPPRTPGRTLPRGLGH